MSSEGNKKERNLRDGYREKKTFARPIYLPTTLHRLHSPSVLLIVTRCQKVGLRARQSPLLPPVPPSPLALQRGERSMNGFHDPNETSLPPRFIRTGDHGDRAIVLAQVPSRTRTIADLSPASLLYGKCSAGPPPPTRPPSSSRSGLVAESHSKADRNEWIRDRRC